jgi:hypothetical protein
LSIAKVMGEEKVRLSWSTSLEEGVLMFHAGRGWTVVPEAPVLEGSEFRVELPAEEGAKIFRLQIGGLIFVDSANTMAGNGSFGNPFQTIALGLAEAATRFGVSGEAQTLYVFSADYNERILVDALSSPGLDITVLSSRLPIVFGGQLIGGDARARLVAPAGLTALEVRNCARFSLVGFEVIGANAGSLKAEDVDFLAVQDSVLSSNGGLNGVRLLDVADGLLSLVQVSSSGTSGSGVHVSGFGGTMVIGDGEFEPEGDLAVNGTGGGFAGVVLEQSPGATFSLLGGEISGTGAEGVLLDLAGSVVLDYVSVQNTMGDGIRTINTELEACGCQIGVDGAILGDGIDLTNNDGETRRADLIFNNIFGLGGPHPTGHGIVINAAAGTLNADLIANFISCKLHTIATTDGGQARALILAMEGNSTLSTYTFGMKTMSIIGSGTDSTIVRAWDYPNQVIGGGVTEGGGILFRKVTFDADGNPGNGFQQVHFTQELTIGAVPPLTIFRVRGDGLRFEETRGSLRIETLHIANDGGFGLFNGGGFALQVGSSVINTINGSPTN